MGNEVKDKKVKVEDKRRFSPDGDDLKEKNPKEETKGSRPEENQKNTEKTSGCEEKTEAGGKDYASSCEEEYKNLPPMSFTTLVFSLSTQAMMSLGEIPDPTTNEENKNLILAKQSIDLLGILEEKTEGNLADEEKKFLKTSLTDLRLRFVNACKCK